VLNRVSVSCACCGLWNFGVVLRTLVVQRRDGPVADGCASDRVSHDISHD